MSAGTSTNFHSDSVSSGPPEPALSLRAGGGGWIVAAGLVLGALVLYWPTTQFGFVDLDDYMYVVGNERVRTPSWESVRIFFGEVWHPTTVGGYYQPLSMLSLMVDAWLTGGDGLDPFYYHATNILLHGLNSVLVFFLARRLVGGRVTPILIAASFLVHPAQVESVSWVSQRKCVLAAFFSFLSVIQYLKYGTSLRVGWLAACWLSMLVANLAKPTAMPLPLVLILLDHWPLKRPVIRSLPEKLAFVPLVIGPAIVAWVSQASAATLGAPRFGSSEMVMKWVGLLSCNLVQYLGNLVWPFQLSPYREIPGDLSWSNPLIGGSLAVVAVLIVLWCVSIRKSKPFFVGTTAFILILSPALGGVQFTTSCVCDRFLYIPMAFLLTPLAVFVRRLEHPEWRRNRGLVVAAGLIVGLLAVMARQQQFIWSSSERLWRHVLAAAPSFPTAQDAVANFELEAGNAGRAFELASEVVRNNAENVSCLLILGRACTRLGRLDEARRHLQRALELGNRKEKAYGWISMAELRAARNEAAEARACYQAALRSGWRSADAIVSVAEFARREGGNCELSIEFHRYAIHADPEDLNLVYRLAQTLRECGHDAESLVIYEEFLRRARDMGADVSAVERAVIHLRESLPGNTP